MFRLCVNTMIIRLSRFNTYLLAAAFLATLAGCQSARTKHEKQIATLRLHLEVGGDAGDRGEPVTVSRAAQIRLKVDKNPFLNEADVAKARVLDAMGGFIMSIQFERRATLMLEQYSATNPGKHIAIVAQWGEKQKETRWLAAPLISRRISDGLLIFTPDATREEADEIVHGLNNVAIQNGNQEKPKDKPKDKSKDKPTEP